MMRIGITTDYVDKQKTGIGYYTYNITKELIKLGLENEFTVHPIHYKESSDPLYENVEDIVIPLLPLPLSKLLTNIFKLPKAAKSLDIIHVTAPNLSDNIGLFFIKDVKKILTIHDLCITLNLTNPKKISDIPDWLYNILWNTSLKFIINKVDMIIAISESTKQDIINCYNVHEDKIKVVHLAVDKRFKPMKDVDVGYAMSPFILAEGAKPGLLKTYCKLKQHGIKDKLVIFGNVNDDYKKTLEKQIINFGLQTDVIFTGYVSDDDVPKLFNLANLFLSIHFIPNYLKVHPCPGFGLPALEAMSCGCPVVTSLTETIQDVVGDAAIMTDPSNLDDAVNAMYKVLTNDNLRSAMIKKGLERAKLFSWGSTAIMTYNLYKTLHKDIT